MILRLNERMFSHNNYRLVSIRKSIIRVKAISLNDCYGVDCQLCKIDSSKIIDCLQSRVLNLMIFNNTIINNHI